MVDRRRRGTPCGFRNKCASSPLSMVEVKLGTVLVGLNLGRFVNCMLWKDTGRTGFDRMIGPLMSRVRCGFKVPYILSQVTTKTLLMWDDETTDKI